LQQTLPVSPHCSLLEHGFTLCQQIVLFRLPETLAAIQPASEFHYATQQSQA